MRIEDFVTFALVILSCVGQLGVVDSAATARASPRPNSKAVEFSAANVTNSLNTWQIDMAVMFYTPWCKYCKQLDPSWEHIANLVTAKSTHVSVGKFNCEVPAENAAICKQLGVDRYPSIFYIGYGSLNQAPAGNPFGTSTIPRLVHFTAALYPEAIYDWVRMLGGVSFWQRRWDDFLGVFTGRSRAARQVEALETANVALDRKVRIFSAELEKYKAKELFDSVPDNGDPFPMLAGLQPGPENLPLRMCVIDLASEYCKYVDHTEEPWCANVRPCKDDKMVSQQCRPVSCPFNHARGCNLVSSCSKSEIVSEYQKALSNADL